jgi:CDP-diacylglycerol--serine O-phosphatidyltransferase
MVTSGVVPGIVMFQLMADRNFMVSYAEKNETASLTGLDIEVFPFIGLILTLGACYRLAKFNIDTRQTNSFIGLPTPAMSLFVISLPLIQEYSSIDFVQNIIANHYFLIAVTLVLTYLMNAELPLFSLKFKEYSFKNNVIKYLFLVVSLSMIIFLQYLSIPLIILLYVVLSIFSNAVNKATV